MLLFLYGINAYKTSMLSTTLLYGLTRWQAGFPQTVTPSAAAQETTAAAEPLTAAVMLFCHQDAPSTAPHQPV